MYVYVCMCMYVCVYVCTYVHMYVCMYVCVYVCMYVCMCVCIQYIWTLTTLSTTLYFNRETNTDCIKDDTFSRQYTFLAVLHTDRGILPSGSKYNSTKRFFKQAC